jgi:hypothetical protein
MVHGDDFFSKQSNNSGNSSVWKWPPVGSSLYSALSPRNLCTLRASATGTRWSSRAWNCTTKPQLRTMASQSHGREKYPDVFPCLLDVCCAESRCWFPRTALGLGRVAEVRAVGRHEDKPREARALGQAHGGRRARRVAHDDRVGACAELAQHEREPHRLVRPQRVREPAQREVEAPLDHALVKPPVPESAVEPAAGAVSWSENHARHVCCGVCCLLCCLPSVPSDHFAPRR